MKKPFRSVFCAALMGWILLSLALAPNASAELYEYIDADGHPHYVESVEQVPEHYRDRLRPIRGIQVPSYGPPPPGMVKGAQPPPTPESRAIPADNEGRTQAYWCQQKERLEARVAELEREKKDLESLGAVDLTQPAGVKAMHDIQRDLERVGGNLEAARAELAGLPAAIGKAGGNPGWVRGSICPTTGPTRVEGAKQPPEDETAPAPNSKEWWQARKKELEGRRASLEEQIAELEGRQMGGGEQYDPVVASRARQGEEKLTTLRSRLGEVEAELADLPNQARKAGVPAGWVR